MTPNPDGSKARCGGPALCPECAAEAITEKPRPEALEAREASARAALSLIGLHLEKVGWGGYIVTDKPGDYTETVLHCPAIEDVEKYIADRAAYQPAVIGAPLSVQPIEQHKPRIADLVHYVSHGTPVRADGSQAFASVCRAAVVAEVSAQHRSRHGVLMPMVTLCVLNPSGMFFQPDMQYDPGTYTGPPRTAIVGELLPPVTCDDMKFTPGTWHWAVRP